MKLLGKFVGLVSFVALFASFTFAATITGTVKGPDGAPFEGAFVSAQNLKTKITVNVLSDKSGRYRIPNLSSGDYDVRINVVGYKADPRKSMSVTNQDASVEFSLQKGTVRWSDISVYQGKMLFPPGKGRAEFVDTCFGCHGFQARMAATRRDEDGWRDRVTFMRNIVMAPNRRMMSDQQYEDIVSYVNSIFGTDSILPPSPTALPKYKEVVQHFSDDAMNIVYVEYDMPGPSRFPFDANPAKDGSVWIPELSTANGVARLDPATGEMKEFKEPSFNLDNHTHSAVAGPDGTEWFTEQAKQEIGKLDPKTGQVTEIPEKIGTHTVRVAADGTVWGSGTQFSYDPKTGKFTKYGGGAYGLAFDRSGNVWYTAGNQLMMVDAETRQEKKWTAPSGMNLPQGKSIFNRRIAVDDDGVIWFAEYNAGKIASFNPKTEKFREYTLPGGDPTPYALGIQKDHSIWYSSENMDQLVDPQTGKITLYPYAHFENGMREFNMDSQGRMWYGSPANNKVGYFYLAGSRNDRVGGN